MSLILKAAGIAKHAHRLQYRKFAAPGMPLQPFIIHPLRVAGLATLHANVFRYDPELAIAAAWLHDTIEDTDLDLTYLREMVPCEVGNMVNALTKPKGVDKLNYLKGFAGKNEDVLNLKALDRIDNLNDCIHAPESFRRHYLEETDTFVRACQKRMSEPIWGLLDMAIRNVKASLS